MSHDPRSPTDSADFDDDEADLCPVCSGDHDIDDCGDLDEGDDE